MKWCCAALSLHFTNSISNSGVSIPLLDCFWNLCVSALEPQILADLAPSYRPDVAGTSADPDVPALEHLILSGYSAL